MFPGRLLEAALAKVDTPADDDQGHKVQVPVWGEPVLALVVREGSGLDGEDGGDRRADDEAEALCSRSGASWHTGLDQERTPGIAGRVESGHPVFVSCLGLHNPSILFGKVLWLTFNQRQHGF